MAKTKETTSTPLANERYRIPKVYVGEQIITRAKTRFYNSYNIKNFRVMVKPNYHSIALQWLDPREIKEKEKRAKKEAAKKRNGRQDPQNVLNAPIVKRRASVAGASLFSVNSEIRELSSDYLEKVKRFRTANTSAELTHLKPMQSIPTSHAAQNPQNNPSTSKIDNTKQINENIDTASSEISTEHDDSDENSMTNVRIDRADGPQIANYCNADEIDSAEPTIDGTNGKNGDDHQIAYVNGGETHIGMQENSNKNGVVVFSHFDPFRRLGNLPFALKGRPRGKSVDQLPYARRPSLPTIIEEDPVPEGTVQNIENQHNL